MFLCYANMYKTVHKHISNGCFFQADSSYLSPKRPQISIFNLNKNKILVCSIKAVTVHLHSAPLPVPLHFFHPTAKRLQCSRLPITSWACFSEQRRSTKVTSLSLCACLSVSDIHREKDGRKPLGTPHLFTSSLLVYFSLIYRLSVSSPPLGNVPGS